MLLAVRCAACDRPGPSPCPACHAALRAPAPEPDPPGLRGLVAVLRYDGPARALVSRLKYRNQRQALAWSADALAEALTGQLPGHLADAVARRARRGPPDVLVSWAPTTDAHRRARGFDHAELLARAVARRLGVPAVGLLRRVPGPAQTGRPAHERRAGGPSYRVRRPLPPGCVVVVVDDVVTTGSTLRAAVVALRQAGAVAVVPAALARTPSRVAPSVGVEERSA